MLMIHGGDCVVELSWRTSRKCAGIQFDGSGIMRRTFTKDVIWYCGVDRLTF